MINIDVIEIYKISLKIIIVKEYFIYTKFEKTTLNEYNISVRCIFLFSYGCCIHNNEKIILSKFL